MCNEHENKTDLTPECTKTVKHPPESKRFLVVYVFGLFSVALALILLSFVSQTQNEREVLTLSEQLNAKQAELEQQTSSLQGTESRAEVLQQTVLDQEALIAQYEVKLENQTKLYNYFAFAYDVDANYEQITEAWQAQQQAEKMAQALADMMYAVTTGDVDELENARQIFVETYDITPETTSMTDEQLAIFAYCSSFITMDIE